MGLKTARCRFGGLRSANMAWLHPRISARARILSRTSAQPPQSRPQLSGGPESLTPVAGTLASVQSPTEPNAERRVHTPEATQIAQIRRSATDHADKPTGAQSGGSRAMAATGNRHAARVTFQNVRDPSADLAQTVAVSGRGSYGVQIVLICWSQRPAALGCQRSRPVAADRQH
jgi:hypothetical protein